MHIGYEDILIGSKFLDGVLPLVARAVHSIDIIVFDWRLPIDEHPNPVAELLAALQQATTRGVAVRVLVANHAVGDRLQKYGCEVRYLYTRKLMHCKLMLIDNIYAVVGSHNYTVSAFTQNLEASVVVRLPDVENELTAFFGRLWGV